MPCRIEKETNRPCKIRRNCAVFALRAVENHELKIDRRAFNCGSRAEYLRLGPVVRDIWLI